jgi:hypothetical protein
MVCPLPRYDARHYSYQYQSQSLTDPLCVGTVVVTDSRTLPTKQSDTTHTTPPSFQATSFFGRVYTNSNNPLHLPFCLRVFPLHVPNKYAKARLRCFSLLPAALSTPPATHCVFSKHSACSATRLLPAALSTPPATPLCVQQVQCVQRHQTSPCCSQHPPGDPLCVQQVQCVQRHQTSPCCLLRSIYGSSFLFVWYKNVANLGLLVQWFPKC